VKKTISLLVACLVTMGIFGISCKKNDIKELEYQQISTTKYLQAYVRKQGKMVLWFQVFDQVNDKSAFNTYKDKAVKIDKYPAKINENKWIWMLVNNRIEIRLVAYDASKDFQDTDELIKFIKLFDLAGMEQVTGKKLDGKDLQQFIPKLQKQ
jgi:hypothetical protein